MNTITDFGHFGLGKNPTFTFTFHVNGALRDPGGGALFTLTVNGVQMSITLTHAATGTYTWNPSLLVAGFYSGTVYAPEGTGEDSFMFTFAVDPDPNYVV